MNDGELRLRVPEDMMKKLHASIRKSLRSIPSEVVWRLRESFEREEKRDEMDQG